MGKWRLNKMGKSSHRKKTMWWWRQRSGDASLSQGPPKMPSKPPELGKGHRGDSLTALSGKATLLTVQLQPARQYISVFKPPACGLCCGSPRKPTRSGSVFISYKCVSRQLYSLVAVLSWLPLRVFETNHCELKPANTCQIVPKTWLDKTWSHL